MIEIEDPIYLRSDADVVTDALAKLGCTASQAFRLFYQRYVGPFAGASGHLLLDLVEQDENVIAQTVAAREAHGFPHHYLVLSDYVGNAALVYDSTSDAVFDVDFEGSDRELVASTLAPRWPTFEAFLEEHFAKATGA